MIVDGMKKCSKCGEVKSIEEFWRDGRSKDGYYSSCIKCKREYNNSRKEEHSIWNKEYYLKNKEYISEKQKEHYKENKEEISKRHNEYYNTHKQEVSIRAADYYKNNKEIIDARNKKYSETHINERREYSKYYAKENSEKIKDYQKIWYEENKEDYLKKCSLYAKTPNGKASSDRRNHKRRSKNSNVQNTLNARQWLKILEMQNYACDDCKKKFSEKLKPTKDHIIPLHFKWFGLTFGNTRALCRSCNDKKYNHTYFMKWIYELSPEV